MPIPRNALIEAWLDVPSLVDTGAKKSLSNAEYLLASFEEAARNRGQGLFQERILKRCLVQEVAKLLVEHARTRDLTIVPIADGASVEREYAESIIFSSGRPLLIVPHMWKHGGAVTLDKVVIAWDFSRAAARVVADALPILSKAKHVYIVTITDEKELDSESDIARNLSHHGIKAAVDEVEAKGRGVGEVLDNYCESRNAELLVMGAFGHSRTRDFVLGGATKHLLSRPLIPTFLSH
jgi:nucleotide-binding universal stress UspA family protein